LLVFVQREGLAHEVLMRIDKAPRTSRSLRWSKSLPDYEMTEQHRESLEQAFTDMDEAFCDWASQDEDFWSRLLAECSAGLLLARPIYAGSTGN
jgi:hypothetical protein